MAVFSIPFDRKVKMRQVRGLASSAVNQPRHADAPAVKNLRISSAYLTSESSAGSYPITFRAAAILQNLRAFSETP